MVAWERGNDCEQFFHIVFSGIVYVGCGSHWWWSLLFYASTYAYSILQQCLLKCVGAQSLASLHSKGFVASMSHLPTSPPVRVVDMDTPTDLCLGLLMDTPTDLRGAVLPLPSWILLRSFWMSTGPKYEVIQRKSFFATRPNEGTVLGTQPKEPCWAPTAAGGSLRIWKKPVAPPQKNKKTAQVV